jgi:3-deoxy-alpha-D-manno-octulosonate 8-oxidase
MYRNYKGLNHVLYGQGSFGQIEGAISPLRTSADSYVVFLVDHFFEDKEFSSRLPIQNGDIIKYIDVTDEPKTTVVDSIVAEIKASRDVNPVSVIGIGGGSVMDYAKATRLMFTNEGSSSKYQGLDFIKNKGVHCVVVPTISGTGAEVSMTTVLTGPEKKLGIKGNFTPADQLIMDPTFNQTVPDDQRFFTAMDCYIHNVEALNGRRRTVLGDSLGTESLRRCREIFLTENNRTPENDEKLMIASYMGGLSLTYSEVGACHATSYGLATVTNIHHGIGNCVVFKEMEEFYPKAVEEFMLMVEKNNIVIPTGVTANCSDEEIEKMIDVTLTLTFMWEHVAGKNWQDTITRDKLRRLFRRM